MIHLDFRDTRPIYTQVIDGFREQILSGVLRQGERLPSVRELASRLAINPNTIQRAYRELELQGWIVSVPGKGSFIAGVPATAEMRDLLERFDRTAAALLALGATRQELCSRIPQEGGNTHA
ncbi:MAG TPA: GntR family transcriptional regulator [Candidatus Faecousia intestinigallinarum]|nr:GntR family transcriptional regulator [Candidatus Faecousia intestinigallinarum]